LALSLLVFAGCATAMDLSSSASRSDAPCATCAEAKASDQSEKTASSPPAPYTFPEALHAYWHCLMCGPPPDKKDDEKNDKNGKSTDNGHKKDDAKDQKEKDKQDKDKNKDSQDKEKKSDAEDNDKDKEMDKDKDAKEPEESWYSAHAQATVVTQAHSNFDPPYTGPHSLLPSEPMATSITSTLFLDVRLWQAGS